MVFVAPVPMDHGYLPYPQLFAVRGESLPVVLSERLLQQRFPFLEDAIPFAVHALSFTNDHFRVVFEQGNNISQRDFKWLDVKGFLDEGDSSARLVHDSIADYRILP